MTQMSLTGNISRYSGYSFCSEYPWFVKSCTLVHREVSLSSLRVLGTPHGSAVLLHAGIV